MLSEDVAVGGSEGAGGDDELALLRAQNDSSHETTGTGPADHSEQENDDCEGGRGREVERKESSHGKEQVEPGEREEEIGNLHEDSVREAAVIAGESAQE